MVTMINFMIQVCNHNKEAVWKKKTHIAVLELLYFPNFHIMTLVVNST